MYHSVPPYVDSLDRITAVLQTTEFESLSLLPAGAHLPDPARYFKSQFMEKLLDSLKAQADVILIDTPPGSIVADSMTLADKMDALVLIVRTDKTPRQAVLDFCDELSNTDAMLLGLVLNKAPFSKEVINYFRIERRKVSIRPFFVRWMAKMRNRRVGINWPALYRHDA